MNLLFGIQAEHDDWLADETLRQLVAWFEEATEIPLVVRRTVRDCLVAPPERGGGHVELVWLDCTPDPSRA